MLTNQDFADRVDCHHSMASRLRAGKRLPSLEMMERISAEFDIPLLELIAARNKGAEAMGRLLRKKAFSNERQPAA